MLLVAPESSYSWRLETLDRKQSKLKVLQQPPVSNIKVSTTHQSSMSKSTTKLTLNLILILTRKGSTVVGIIAISMILSTSTTTKVTVPTRMITLMRISILFGLFGCKISQRRYDNIIEVSIVCNGSLIVQKKT